jgi:hypothetical protein
MHRPTRNTQVIEGVAPAALPIAELLQAGQPAILKGVARQWPLVQRGLESPESAIDYLVGFCSPRPATLFSGAPEIQGRFHYNADVSGMNFQSGRQPLAECLQRLRGVHSDANAPALYVGSTDVDLYLPGLRAANDLGLGAEVSRPTVSIWLGNRTVACAHYDQSHNLACCMVGRRRFTLFPPRAIHDLYPGPLEPTPGGQVVSMVDFNAPDFERFPRFRNALELGEVAELEPGDVLFYPALWWHHVEALDSFNALINYWWTTAPGYMDSPQVTLTHALLSLRDRSESEKAAWRELFDYYVFGPAERAGQHLPEKARGNLGPMDETRARRLRAWLLSRLNR